MPLPTPKIDEKKSEFISRCIVDVTSKNEFPNVAQRIAVCQSQWDRKDETKNLTVRKNKDCPDGYEHKMPNGEWMCGKTHKEKKSDPYSNETYNDYPQAATQNAKRVLKWVDENGWGGCGTNVGKQRCHQIANREKLSRSVIARVASFKRHQKNSEGSFEECGPLMWNAWGGTEMIEWAIKKLKKIDNE